MPNIAPERQVAPREMLTVEALRLASMGTLTRADLATGRGLTYEWEFFVDQLFRLVAAGGGGGGGTGGTYEFVQSSAAAVWTVQHDLATFPNVVLVGDDGQELLAEVHYPDDSQVVIIHGRPYSGTAYLRY